jgi:hypothetical protein
VKLVVSPNQGWLCPASILGGELGFELLNALGLSLVHPGISRRTHKRLVGLGEEQIDPEMNLTGLEPKLFGQGRD